MTVAINLAKRSLFLHQFEAQVLLRSSFGPVLFPFILLYLPNWPHCSGPLSFGHRPSLTFLFFSIFFFKLLLRLSEESLRRCNKSSCILVVAVLYVPSLPTFFFIWYTTSCLRLRLTTLRGVKCCKQSLAPCFLHDVFYEVRKRRARRALARRVSSPLPCYPSRKERSDVVQRYSP